MSNVFRATTGCLICLVSVASFAQFPELATQYAVVQEEIDQVLQLTNGEDQTQIGFTLSLARNYYQLDDYVNAEKYYLAIIDQDICSKLDYKALAICLSHNGKQSLADDFYRAYTEGGESTSFTPIWSLPKNELPAYSRVREEKMTNYDFIYGSLNPNGTANLNIDRGPVTANVACNSIINMEAAQLPVDEFNKVGSFCPGPQDNSYFYSYQNNKGFFEMYYLGSKNGNWTKPKLLELGEGSANYAFPMFINNVLYFSSDMAGGRGGFDIYQSSWNGKSMESPTNLGSMINSDKNDILPSIVDGRFSFSTNGLPGRGGYDIYYSDWNFEQITPEDYPVNSSNDDFILIKKDEKSASVIKRVESGTNVYSIEVYQDYVRTLNGHVLDENGNKVNNAKVLISEGYETSGDFTSTDVSGEFSVEVNDTIEEWTIEVMKDNFTPLNFILKLSTLGDNPLIVSLERITPPEPEPVYIVNSPSRNVIPSEPNSDQLSGEDSVVSDTSPRDDIFNEVNREGQYYIIYASTRSYKSAYSFWQEWSASFPESEILENEAQGVFRVGIYAGTTRAEAMKAYKRAKNIKSDAWILRPDQQN